MRELEYKTENVSTKDHDDDDRTSAVTYAVVDEGTAGQEVALRNGEARKLVKGDVVVKHGNAHDVFSAKEWADMWADSDRVVTAPNAPKDAVASPAIVEGDASHGQSD